MFRFFSPKSSLDLPLKNCPFQLAEQFPKTRNPIFRLTLSSFFPRWVFPFSGPMKSWAFPLNTRVSPRSLLIPQLIGLERGSPTNFSACVYEIRKGKRRQKVEETMGRDEEVIWGESNHRTMLRFSFSSYTSENWIWRRSTGGPSKSCPGTGALRRSLSTAVGTMTSCRTFTIYHNCWSSKGTLSDWG